MENNKEIDILLSRTDRCMSCLERWVDNKNLTLNAACLLLTKVACKVNENTSLEAEKKLLDILYKYLEGYIHTIYEKRRENMLNGK